MTELRVLRLVKAVLGLGDEQSVDTKLSLKQQGVDSFLVVELTEAIGREFHVEVDVTFLFDNTNIERIVEALNAKLFATDAAVASVGAAVPVALAAPVAPSTASQSRERVAIVGYACRLPGVDAQQPVRTSEVFWQNLLAQRVCIHDVPKNRVSFFWFCFCVAGFGRFLVCFFFAHALTRLCVCCSKTPA